MSPDPSLKHTLSTPPSALRIRAGSSADGLSQVVEGLLLREQSHGVDAGRNEAYTTAAKALEAAGQRFDEVAEAARAQVGETAVVLALEIARHLLRAEVEAGRYDLEAVVREALEISGTGRRNCTVHLNPKDMERLSETPFRTGTELEADISVPVGDVHITTPDGLLVRDLDRAVDTIGERILGELR